MVESDVSVPDPYSTDEDEEWLPSDSEVAWPRNNATGPNSPKFTEYLKKRFTNTTTSAKDTETTPVNSLETSADNNDNYIEKEKVFEKVMDSQQEEIFKPKRRRSNPQEWKREKKKKELRQSRDQVNMPECRCKCKQKLTIDLYKKIHADFKNLSSHTQQNLYLRGCITSKPAARHSNKNKPPRNVFQYSVIVNQKSVSVCQNFFLALHGIKRDRLRKKILKFEITDVRDFRGKHSNRKNRLPADTLEKINIFLKNLPSIESHYSRSQNRCKKYLEADLTVAQLHKNYSKSYPENPVKHGMFNKIFVENFNYSFAHPKKDICAVCTTYIADLNSAKMRNNMIDVQSLTVNKELHLRRSQVFFDLMKQKKEEKDKTNLVICFDFEKNLPLPVTNIGDEYYKRQLWLHNFGINNVVTNQATMFLFTENFATKGPNEVITALHYYIKKYRTNEHRKLTIFCDNCFSQNKNKFLFTYLDSLCASRLFEDVVVFYPIPGHSMMPIDRCFALVEKKRLKSEKVDNPDYYINLIKSARIKNPFEIVFLEHSLLTKNSSIKDNFVTLKVGDYKKLYSGKIKQSIPGISKCRSVMFCATDEPIMRDTMTGDYDKNVSLYKVGCQRFLANLFPPNAYNKFLRLKPEKLENIKFLVRYIKNENDREFYKVLEERKTEEEKEDLDVEEYE